MKASGIMVGGLFLVLGLLGAWQFFAQRDLADSGPETSDRPRIVHDEPVFRPRTATVESIDVVADPTASATVETEAPTGTDARAFVELNREALEDLKHGRLHAAVEKLEQLCADAPDVEVYCTNLAEALARLARQLYDAARTDEERMSAIEVLARAVALAPKRRDLAARLDRWRKVQETEEDFWRDESEHFELVYDGDRGGILQSGLALMDELEALYLEFGELFARFPVEEGRPKIRVVLYDNNEFDDITGLGHWAGGVFDGVVRVPLRDISAERGKLRRTLRHELVHAFVREVGGKSVPGWLNEGLAQWVEWRPVSVRDRIVERAEKRMQGHEPFPLKRLQRSLSSFKQKDEILRAYAQALLVTREIVSLYGERPLFGMIEGCARGESCDESFQRLTGSSLSALVKNLGQ